jgi:hypothetical protein
MLKANGLEDPAKVLMGVMGQTRLLNYWDLAQSLGRRFGTEL